MRQQFCILVLILSGLAAFPAWAQQGAPAPPDKGQPAQQKSSISRSKEKPALVEATHVSTAEAAHKAAEAAAQGHGSEPALEAPEAPEVLEFRAASPGGQGSVGATATKESKKPALKSVHGDAYGASDSHGAAKQTGGAVGATSKGGKASIYVETDRSHETTPAPH
jgi:hypothetical protein